MKFNRNRNIIIFAICFLFVYVVNICSQISVPNPSIYLAFDTTNPAYESVSKRSGTCTGAFQQGVDRFGNMNRTIMLDGKGTGIRLSGFDINAVHTVSFWIEISDPSEIPAGAIPFGPTDTKYEFYNWTDKENRILKGLGRQKATIGFDRFIPKPDGSIVPWYLWSYSPAQFDQIGLYHIFVVHGMYYTRLIMYKPDSTKAFSYIWMGDQGFPTNKYLYVGGYGEHYPFTGAMDDFKVYNAELTDAQIDFQHTAEYPKDVFLKIKNKNSGKYAVVANASKENGALVVQHSTGIGNDEWILSFTGINECMIKNLHSDKLMVVKDASMQVGAEVIQHEPSGYNNEIWVLEYSIIDPKYFRLRNKNSDKYLAVSQNSKTDNSKLIQVNRGEESVYWSFENALPDEYSDVETGFYRIKNKKSKLYLTVLNKGSFIGANLVQHSRTDSEDDIGFDTWLLNPSGLGKTGYFITNSVSSYSMTNNGDNTEGTFLTQGRYDGTAAFDWQLLPTGVPGEYHIKNVGTFLNAVVKNASVEENAHIVQYHSGTGDNEIWQLERVYYSDPPLQEGFFKIRNINSYKLMVVKNASKADNAEIIQYNSGEENAKWEILPAAFGFVQLRNKNSQKCLVVKNASLEIGEALIQHGVSTPNSYWRVNKVIYTESGTRHVAYTLRNKLSGLYAVVKDASSTDGIPIIQYNTGEKNKLWAFEKQASNTLTRTFDSEPTEIASDVDRPEVMVDCKNDIILLDYPFKSSTELIVRIIDLTGRQVYEGKKQVNGSNNVITISHFNSALNANQFYVVSIHSTDGKVNCSAKAIMSK